MYYSVVGITLCSYLSCSQLFRISNQSMHSPSTTTTTTTRFAKHMPVFASVVISERDEYIAQTICEIAQIGFGQLPPPGTHFYRKGKIVAVVGAGHLSGIERCLLAGGSTLERMQDISSSSRHNSTWPGRGMLHVIDAAQLYGPKR